jgi:F-type H+-transporting ATPase subunit gamma
LVKSINIEKTNTQNSFDFISVNKYAEKIAKKFTRNDDKSVTKNENVLLASYIEKKITSSHIRSILTSATAGFVEKRYSDVYVVYTDFTNVNTQKVQTLKLLPFSDAQNNFNDLNTSSTTAEVKTDTKKVNTDSYLFEPSQSEVYDKAISLVLHHVLSAAIERSLAAEHAARMMAMKTATDNASDMLGDLKLYYNKVRQAAITQEIAEISSGAMALAK